MLRELHKNNPDKLILSQREIIIRRLAELAAEGKKIDAVIAIISKENTWHEEFVAYNIIFLENRGIIGKGKQDEFSKQKPI